MSISPRITQRLMTESSLASMQAGLGRVARTQEQLTTGRVINRPSDSPSGTNAAMQLRQQITQNAQFLRNAGDGLARLGTADTVLTSMMDSVRRAHDLALQGASTGSVGLQAREALAMEVQQIRDGLLSQANSTHLGMPLFGGTTTGKVAYVKDGAGVVTYAGDSNAVNRRIGADDNVRVDITGPEIFGPAGDDLFDVLADISAKLTSDPGSLGSELDRLDAAMSRITTSLADVGSRFNRLEAGMRINRDAELSLQDSLSQVENVDMARAMVDLQMNEVAYQAALGATARVLQPSLLDFLR
jgi:flagellar hook-associated protein 3 FlgL